MLDPDAGRFVFAIHVIWTISLLCFLCPSFLRTDLAVHSFSSLLSSPTPGLCPRRSADPKGERTFEFLHHGYGWGQPGRYCLLFPFVTYGMIRVRDSWHGMHSSSPSAFHLSACSDESPNATSSLMRLPCPWALCCCCSGSVFVNIVLAVCNSRQPYPV